MVNVKIFGLLRIDTGIKEFDISADKVKDIFETVVLKAKENNVELSLKDISSSAVLVNGKQANKNTKLKDGDKVVFISMVAGG